jgi:hypothetical protein
MQKYFEDRSSAATTEDDNAEKCKLEKLKEERC